MLSEINKDFFKKLALLALPVSLQFLLHSSRYITDVIMIGNVGESELAAVGISTSIQLVANSVIFGLSGGVGILTAQYFGAKDQAGIRRNAALGVLAGGILMIPVGLIFYMFPEMVVRVGTDQPEIIPLGAVYLKITALLPLMVSFIVCVGAAFNSIGKPHLNLVFTAVSVLLNAFFNWILIFGHLGAPAMGLGGAAIATNLSMVFQIVAILIYMLFADTPVQITLKSIKDALKREHSKKFLDVSIPLTVGGVVWHVGSFAYQSIYGHMGATELVAITIITPLRTVAFAFFWGIASAAGVMMGHHLGANEFTMAWKRSRALIVIGITISIIASSGIWLLREPIFLMFGDLDKTTLAMVMKVLIVLLLTIPILAANVIGIVGILQSGADNRFILIMDMVCQWGAGIPLSWLAAFYFKASLDIVFLAAFSEEIVKVFIWIPRYIGKKWVRNIIT